MLPLPDGVVVVTGFSPPVSLPPDPPGLSVPEGVVDVDGLGLGVSAGVVDVVGADGVAGVSTCLVPTLTFLAIVP